MIPHREIAAAKVNLALHVRGKRDDGRHDIETVFAFCTDGDRLSGEDSDEIALEIVGPFAGETPGGDDNLVIRAARALAEASGAERGATLRLDKKLPVASGIGGGSADAAAALRLLTVIWGIDPKYAQDVAPTLGSDVPACLLSMSARGSGAGEQIHIEDAGVSGAPILLINPRVQLSTAEVFARWDGEDHGPLGGWREGRNDLERAAVAMVPQVETVLAWLGTRPGATTVRMSGSGATCFALFSSDEALDLADHSVPREWWKLATSLR